MPTIRPRARSVRALGCMGTRPVENYYFSSFVGLRRAARLRLAGGRSPEVGLPRQPHSIRVPDAATAAQVRTEVAGEIPVTVAPTPELDALFD